MTGKGKSGEGTRDHPWKLKTPSGTSEFLAFRDETLDPPALVVKSGSTELRYHVRCINDLHQMLKARGDWMLLGSADEQKPAAEGRSRRGDDRPRIPSAVGTDSRRDSEVASACMSLRSSRPSISPRSNTIRRTTGCGRSRFLAIAGSRSAAIVA